MIIGSSLIRGRFSERVNRFLVSAWVGDKQILAHLPNPGRMREILYPGADILLARKKGKTRKTNFEVFAAKRRGERILLDTRLSNAIAEEAIRTGKVPALRGYEVVKREFSWKDSRFDFLLSKAHSKCIVEVKACTLIFRSVALFPDAPTARGRRHMETLALAVRRGFRACVLFLVHAPGAAFFSANNSTDPGFSHSLLKAKRIGVEAYAFQCSWIGGDVCVAWPIPFLANA